MQNMRRTVTDVERYHWLGRIYKEMRHRLAMNVLGKEYLFMAFFYQKTEDKEISLKGRCGIKEETDKEREVNLCVQKRNAGCFHPQF